MSKTKPLLDSLLHDIYGSSHRYHRRSPRCRSFEMATRSLLPANYKEERLRELETAKLRDIVAILDREIHLMGHFLERVLISRDHIQSHQELLCAFVDAILHVTHDDAHARMRFSLSPPPHKAVSPSTESAAAAARAPVTSPTYRYSGNNTMQRTNTAATSPSTLTASAQSEQDAAEAASDYNQWLHAMKLVARLPGGMPPEFRRKLWLSLADKYLKSKNVDWPKEEEKCFCEKWREDDEELGIQIVKDLHRTGSNLCTGPAGNINQAKLKRILLGYARYNPEVGYCQGFNMLGALILQVMDKEEAESIKVMIYLVEGVLPPGYFCGSMGGLQADMGVFRELMQTKLPRLAKHLQKLQGPIENAYEPPLTNVFTMQWFLTLFCTCLPMTCVLRVWDLILIEGSDVLLRTALVLWGLLEERVLKARTADDFYGKMGSFSSELLNGHLIDSNGLIERVVKLGAIPDIQKLRDKHLYNIAPLRSKQGIHLYFDEEEPEMDEDSRLAVASVWGIPWARRGSHSQSATKQLPTSTPENKERIALDISLLKKQYDRLRERQKQAHIILTTACSTNPRSNNSGTGQSVLPVNQLLMGRPAIVTNKGRRPPAGAIPPARKPSLPIILQTKPAEKQLRRGETISWRDMDPNKRRRDSLTWKEIKADRASMLREGPDSSATSKKLRSRMGKSDSSSYSEESDDDAEGSSTDTSLCDDDDPASTCDKSTSMEDSPKRRVKSSRRQKQLSSKLLELNTAARENRNERPKSWAPSSNEIPFTLMTSDSPVHSGDERSHGSHLRREVGITIKEDDGLPQYEREGYTRVKDLEWSDVNFSPLAGDLATSKLGPLHIQTDSLELPAITSTSQLSPMPDISSYLKQSSISPLPTPKPPHLVDSTSSLGSGEGDDRKKFDVNDDGVTNQYFERVNSVERPTNLDLFYSLNEDDTIRTAYETEANPDHQQILSQENLKKDETRNSEEILSKDEHPKVEAISVLRSIDLDRSKKVILIGEESTKPQDLDEELLPENRIEPYKGKFLDSEYAYEDTEAFDPRTHIRDDNIPGENRDDFNEKHDKADKTTKSMGLTKKQAVLNANKKRRDPRRLTRSSTIDIEERYQALEKHMSLEEAAKAAPKELNKCIESMSHEDDAKLINRIPSTADLEERFNSLEKQRSFGKDNEVNENVSLKCEDISKTEFEDPVVPSISTSNDEGRFISLELQPSTKIKEDPLKLKMKHLPTISSVDAEERLGALDNRPSSKFEEKTEMQDSAKLYVKYLPTAQLEEPANTDLDELMKPEKKRIPSTSDLEDRFEALARQMSSSGSGRAKGSVDLKDEKSDNKSDRNGDKPPSRESKEDAIRSESRKSSPEGETTQKKDNSRNEENATQSKPVLKKLPSTAELEDRFNALERKLSTQKSSPSKSKKEPPDENVETERQVSKRQAIEEQKTQMERKDSAKQQSNSETEVKSETRIEEKSHSDKIDEKENMEEKENPQSAVDKGKKKSPPSTAELEKRFQAIEKQLSSSSLEMKKRPQSEPDERDEVVVSTEATVDNHQKGKQEGDKKKEIPTKEIQAENIRNSTTSKEEDEKSKKSIKSFEEKCKAVNEKINEASSTKPDKKSPSDSSTSKAKPSESKDLKEKSKTESFTEKMKTINKQLEAKEKAEVKPQEAVSEPATGPSGKRRASEPPSTEDLERRYETLKRRMSSKTVAETEKGETVEEAMERIEKEVCDDNNREETTSATPPSTENLEKRFEALQKQNSTMSDKMGKTQKTLKAKVETEEISKQDVTKNSKKSDSESKASRVETSKSVQTTPPEEVSRIPMAPPMPPDMPIPLDPASKNQRRALIQELQRKMKSQPNDENLKPSVVNPNRKQPRHIHPRADETSEAHADSAFYRSGNYEPWLMSTQSPHKMVRRFSDLPSRADLENRVQFLEKQLLKKFYKQRCASDSEVTSRMNFSDARSRRTPRDDEVPSTSAAAAKQVSPESDLEKRVLLLEKQLSENSLKLLEAMKAGAFESPQKSGSDSDSPRKLSPGTIDATGKELVRYTHFGELEETESHKPINISINIKMLLNKDGEVKKRSDPLPTTEELERRLEMLEQQLSIGKPRLSSTAEKTEREDTHVSGDEYLENEDEVFVENVHVQEKEEGNKEGKPTKLTHTQKAAEEESRSESEKTPKGAGEEVIPKRSEKVASHKTGEKEETPKSSEKEVVSRICKKEETLKSSEQEEVEKICEKKDTERRSEEEVQKICKNKEEKKETANVSEKEMPKVLETEKTPKEEYISTKTEEPPKEETRQRTQSSKQADKPEPPTEKKEQEETSKDSSDGDTQKGTQKQTSDQAPPECNEIPAKMIINATDVGPVDPKDKTLVLLLDNEPKAVKVRRLTRANTEELEGLFQALEKQINDRNLVKTEDGRLKRADTKEGDDSKATQPSEEAKAIMQLTQQIEKLTADKSDSSSSTSEKKPEPKKEEEEFDWGIDPVKRHLKRKTVHLPSTKELEARFRSLERQIKLLEDVENIDVEQRLTEIERKIKLQYSLSHEKDLSKFLELCEGKGLDDPIETAAPVTTAHKCECECPKSPHGKPKSPYTSPSRSRSRTPPHTPPSRSKSPARSKSPVTARSPGRSTYDDVSIPGVDDLEHRYRSLNLPRSKSKENLKKKIDPKKQPIHPLEMLLDPSPDDSEIPTTGELEHRIRMLEEKRITPSPPPMTRHRSRSPTIDDLKRKKMLEDQRPRTPIHALETMVTSPTRRDLPTEEELEARVKALESDQKFDFKTQRNFMEFNQKLKDVISPSLSFEEFKSAKSREQSPHRASDMPRPTTPKSALRDSEAYGKREESTPYRSTSPKVIRFSDDEDYRPKSRTEAREPGRMVGRPYEALEQIQENSKILHRILEKTLADSSSSIYGSCAALTEGLDEMGSRLMRETSPLQRTGTHTGVPLRTNDNINERLSSIKETIKSIDSLCEEKPYRKEKCQRYIDSLFSDSVHFASKKSSLEDLHSRRSRSPSRATAYREYTPSIRVSDHSLRPSEHYLSRSIGSAESLRSSSPLRAASPLHHRSTRDLRRELSPRRRIDEEREEYESRVRRAHMLPHSILNDFSDLSSGSLIKFHKVDSQQLDTYERESRSRSASRSPLRSTYGSRETMMTSHNSHYTTNHHSNTADSYTPSDPTHRTAHNTSHLDRPVSPYRQPSHNLLGYDSSPLKRSSTPVYNPSKLEIRHTTVTSTFYDRLLTEKNLSRPPSRSPVVSPSAPPKSYLDLPSTTSSASANNKSKDSSPTASSATDQLNSFMGINASLGIGAGGNGSSRATAYTATHTPKSVDANVTAPGAAPTDSTPTSRFAPSLAAPSAMGPLPTAAGPSPISYNLSSSLPPSGYIPNRRGDSTSLTFSSIAPIITSTTTNTSTTPIPSMTTASSSTASSSFTTPAFSGSYRLPSSFTERNTKIGATPYEGLNSSTLGMNSGATAPGDAPK